MKNKYHIILLLIYLFNINYDAYKQLFYNYYLRINKEN